MSDYEKALVESNDARAGRVVPGWKFWVMVALMACALIAAYRIGDSGLGSGWLVPVAFILGCVHEALCGTYRKRSIR